MKQLFEAWIRSMDKNGRPNRPDVSSYNHYLMANLMSGATAADMLDLVARMEDCGVAPNTASFNLVLKAMHSGQESEAAEKLLQRLAPCRKCIAISCVDFVAVLICGFRFRLDECLVSICVDVMYQDVADRQGRTA